MKEFIKYTLATVVGLVLTSICMTVICVVSVAGMIADENMSSKVEKNSVLRIKLHGSIEEVGGESSPLSMIQGKDDEELAQDKILDALKKAADDKNIKGIYLEAGSVSAEPAQLQEIRQAMLEFKKSGKWIVAYGDEYTQGSYYLCSVADKVYMNPIGSMSWSGMSSTPMFYKGLMEKVGVKMQVFKVGTYKSAVEPFICTEMSPANKEQVKSYLASIWGNMQKEVAQSRNLKVDALNALSDTLTIFADAELSVKGGLVDQLCYKDEVKAELKKRLELKDDEGINFATINDVANLKGLNEKEDDEVAVYYAYGNINETEPKSPLSSHCITTDKTIKDLQDLCDDDDVKAVVIRVNSPGGSAYASEQIWHQMQLLKAKKPVVISMGGLAASGGYYISCGANKIFAEPTTLTGSIGIFGMFPDPSEFLTQKLGLSFDVVKTNAMSDLGAMGRPFSEEECRMIQASVNKGYELFTGRVAKGRNMPQDSVKAIAEGRVWTGEQALKIGLVDELGNLDDAIAAAAKLANLEKYSVSRSPKPQPWYSNFMDDASDDYMESRLRQLTGEYYPAIEFLMNLKDQSYIQARMPYDPNLR